jgi:DNA-binding transcriptional ArsR family regulator
MPAAPNLAHISTDPRFPWQWCVMSLPAMLTAALQLRSPITLRLLFLAPSRLDWREWRQLNQYEIASLLGTKQPSISRALKELLAAGLIERRGSGPRQEWRLMPELGWRGNVASFAAEAERRKKAKLMPLDDFGDGTAA